MGQQNLIGINLFSDNLLKLKVKLTKWPLCNEQNPSIPAIVWPTKPLKHEEKEETERKNHRPDNYTPKTPIVSGYQPL